jgi:hypothetical protein
MSSSFQDDFASVVSSEADATIGGDNPNVEDLDGEEEESSVTVTECVVISYHAL